MGKYAFISLTDNTHKTVTREQGEKMQAILDGTAKPENEAQADYVMRIKHIYGIGRDRSNYTTTPVQQELYIDNKSLAAGEEAD